MGHHALRHDNECQNCGYTVDVAYCSKCGQQNTETRQSFHHLLTHFAEDLTHYDGAFWKTIKYLLFRPGRLTIEYLQGHRMRFVPPVKLYIFISFVAFFLLALLAPGQNEHETPEAEAQTVHTIVATDGIRITKESVEKDEKIESYNGVVFTSVKQLDSLHTNTPDNLKMPAIGFHLKMAAMLFKEKNPSTRDLVILVAHTIPKVLFIYMPIFAFWLWLVHGKKRWYFFDHGIFTLHYFSFLLLVFTINFLFNSITEYISNFDVYNILYAVLGIPSLIYPVFYFFRAHSRFYGERKAISRLKSILLFFINFICFMIIAIATFVYMAYNLH